VMLDTRSDPAFVLPRVMYSPGTPAHTLENTGPDDLVVIGVDGIDAEAGCTTHHEVEAHTDLALIERAHRVVVVADSSKIGGVAFARICPVTRVDTLITDRAANVRSLRALRDAGVTVETV